MRATARNLARMGALSRWACLAVIAVGLACAQPALATTQPTITASPDSPGNTRSLSFSFSGDPLEPFDTFQCRLDGPGGVVEDWTDCTSPKPYTLAPAAADGTYTFSVHAID